MEHCVHLHQDGTLGVSSGGGQKVHTVCTRLFEHVYTGTRADRKKALEASDISSLVRETERSLQGGTLPNAQQKTRIFFVLMFMLRAYLSWIWHTCTKGTCREIYYRTDDGRRDGR